MKYGGVVAYKEEFSLALYQRKIEPEKKKFFETASKVTVFPRRQAEQGGYKTCTQLQSYNSRYKDRNNHSND